ncbi:putative RNA recognition motif domain, nucleotide-binding alpha-beta plait domain superfamily [Helianthus annuus]|uniref:RNA recognition motif domain, nucleotide-binding alpha-beta plait domain superfamily n=1 Tax=Helianthus annuus TaxID=4232 RepID=A0A9K3H295_HELAN|nr:putative RNA recognition motif domain, nucleotide-binding alpha-beta plait domain superfamily [Helianthus annuus]KAJ0450551.1 putative RNA recognition motif domain, nucleotide-binding alpha-beta plait domain superfamily [Helianthus annuus]KAJ0472401.1 putative RNA recognition motif domain, nucleotide-binding alpha-beta plait domain superfamily [Helianthus annuus]KAJ0648001.1 putative RNA recognition motif domain, nucleotide-binding alpha-beta plait domain superfamily [Helianthus annuus]KAJ06
MDEEGPWLDPHHLRKKGKSMNSSKASKENITKFYITNLPIGCRPWDVVDFARGCGEVAGMFIARKKDKEGRTFGFLSLRNMKDARATERVFNGLKLGGCSLRVNIAKFAAENVEWWDVDAQGKKDGNVRLNTEKMTQSDAGLINRLGSNNGWVREGVSFKDMLKQGGSSDGVELREKEVEVHSETATFFDLQGRALVGRTRDISTLTKMNVLIKEAGISNFKIYYLGGLSILVSFDDDIVAADFLLEVNMWNRWFSSLDMWAGQSM